MTQILRDWLRAKPNRSIRTYYTGTAYEVQLWERGEGLAYEVHQDLDTAERLAVLSATGELEAENG